MTLDKARLVLIVMTLPWNVMAQEALLLRHNPTAGTIVRTAFETVTIVWAFDGRRFESADHGIVQRTALQGPRGEAVVHLAYDSVRTRTRDSNGQWREFLVSGADSSWIQVGLDERMRVTGTNQGKQLSGVTGLMRILTGIPRLELPEGSLTAGDGWSNPTVVSVIPGLRNETVPPTINGIAQIVLDSMVVRSRDTLGFLSLNGQFPAATFVDVIGPGRVTASGDLVGSLVWSTAWNGFVSGVSKTRMVVVRASSDDEVEGGEKLVLEATTRHQVKP